MATDDDREAATLDELLGRFEAHRVDHIAAREIYYASANLNKKQREELTSRFRKLARPVQVGGRRGLHYTLARAGVLYKLHFDGQGFERSELAGRAAGEEIPR